jgi:hypothetical protein
MGDSGQRPMAGDWDADDDVNSDKQGCRPRQRCSFSPFF